MPLRHTFALMVLALLLAAGLPGSSSATVLVSARALHTSVHPARRAHHHHVRHRHATAAELRSASHPRPRHGHPRTPAAPLRHAGRSHALPPHASNKLQRSHTRGGTPYALGLASLSLGLWTAGSPLPGTQNDEISNPRSGHLKGRSPPRGSPPSATPYPARPVPAVRVPAEFFRNSPATRPDAEFPAKAPRESQLTAHRVPCAVSAPLSLRGPCFALPVFPQVPDRASEGRTAGHSMPSWRNLS